jgi:hypothetical protein
MTGVSTLYPSAFMSSAAAFATMVEMPSEPSPTAKSVSPTGAAFAEALVAAPPDAALAGAEGLLVGEDDVLHPARTITKAPQRARSVECLGVGDSRVISASCLP